jgi:beta-N-acetylhexosaminidase
MIAALAAVVLGAGVNTGTPTPASAAARAVPARHLQEGNEVPRDLSLTNPAAVQFAAEEVLAGAVGKMSARQLAGQRVIYSYQGLQPPASLLSLIRHGEAAGVIFFAANYRSNVQFAAAVHAIRAANASRTNPARAYPLLLMTDQEGGQVRRLPGAPVLSEKQIGELTPLAAAGEAAGQAGAGAAANLAAHGLNVDLAPVLDVYRRPGDFDDQYQRSYSSKPDVVSVLGARFITAMQAANVAATAKHFPGLGPATADQDTDKGPVTISLSAAALASHDEYPYRAAIAAGVRLVMVSWATYPHLGSDRPAGLSAAIVQGLLRNTLGFGGVTITDSIGAGALAHYGSFQNRALLAASAGMDLILSPSEDTGAGVQITDGLEADYRSGRLDRPGFQAAVSQILQLRQGLSAGQ